MMQIIYCRQCGSANTPVGKAMSTVKIMTWDMCVSCNHQHNKEINLNFCCVDCMVKYVSEHGQLLVDKSDQMQERDWPYIKCGDQMKNSLRDLPQAEAQPRPLPKIEYGTEV